MDVRALATDGVVVLDGEVLYDAPGRDERGNVSAAYLCRPATPDQSPTAREEARRVDTFDPADLPETGFDHADIVGDAVTL